MADATDTNSEIAALKREVAELSGLALATGIILTQLLQRSCKRELDPQGVAGRIMENARNGIEGFSKENDTDPVTTERALAAVEQYEEQIRSVLRV